MTLIFLNAYNIKLLKCKNIINYLNKIKVTKTSFRTKTNIYL